MFAQLSDLIDKTHFKDYLKICQMARNQFKLSAFSILSISLKISIFKNCFIFYFDIKQRADFILNFDNSLSLLKELLSLMRQSGDIEKI